MQACGEEPSIARRVVRAWGKHAAPEECDNLLTRFAWNLDQRGVLVTSGCGLGSESMQRFIDRTRRRITR